VLALPRTWKFSKGKSLKALVTHLPRWWYTPIRLPTAAGRRRTFWVYAKAVRLRHRGNVTVVLSKCRRNDGPKPTKSLVTKLPEIVPARHIVAIYLRRWGVEVLLKEWKGVVGLGQHQGTKQVSRGEHSVAVAIMASLLLLKRRAKDIPADRPWSALSLQRAVAWEMVQARCERSARQRARKWLQMAQAA
jgi:hypothetical protein